MSSSPAEFQHDDIRVVGVSLAGEETAILLPELNVAFDVGSVSREMLGIDHVFLSHGHMDHSAGIAYYFSQRMFMDNAPGKMWMPAPLLDPVRRLLQLWGEIDGNEPPAILNSAIPGQDIEVRRGLLVRPFEVNHPSRRRDRTVVRSLGYSVIDVRQKLCDEFKGKSGPELVELKKQGVEITRRVEVPLVAYCGDTAPGDFLSLEHVSNARVLLLECTFTDAEDLRRAVQGGHMHVTDLKRIIPRLQNERIVLTHLTRRTALGEAKEAVRRELGEAWSDRISFLMEWRRRRAQKSRDSSG